MHHKALETRRTALGETHPETAKSYWNIDMTLSETGDHKNALVEFRKAHAIHVLVFGTSHSKSVWTLQGLQQCEENVGSSKTR